MKPISLLTLFLFIQSYASALSTVVYSNASTQEFIGKQLWILEDKSNALTIADVQYHSGFSRSNDIVPNLGISNSTFWIKVNIQNTSNKRRLYLELRQPIIDHFEVYEKTEAQLERIYKGGDSYVFSARSIKNPSYFIPIEIPTGQTYTYYIQLKSAEQLLALFSIADVEHTYNYISKTDTLFGLYIGILIALFLYNAFVYFSLKERTYLLYIIYILLIGLTQSSLLGYTFLYFFPNNPYLANITPYISSILVSISALYFMRDFLITKRNVPRLHRFSYFIQTLYILTGLLTLMGIYSLAYSMVLILAAIVSLFMLIVGYVVLKNGYKPALYYLIAWSTLLLGIIIFVLKDFGILPVSFITSYTMPIGSALEVILLSFAMANRINILKKEKEASQQALIQEARLRESIVRQQNVVLEEKVADRTRNLEATLSELKETQSNLVDSEKMASLGQLTAGIAHEINNPINFVSSNIYPLKLDIQDLKSVIACYDSLDKNSEIEQVQNVLSAVETLKTNISYNELLIEIDILLKGIEDGANRTSEIVQSLKTFSHLDEADFKSYNVEEGLKSSLVLLSSLLNGNVTVQTDFKLIEEIDCFPGKINQVFMNILTNGIQAMQKNKSDKTKILHIQTYKQNDIAVIEIADTGPGIPESIIHKIFDPFFTTKEVGQGIGLGLSIVHTIIKKHKGEILVNSTPQVGTTFTIKLPLVQIQSEPVLPTQPILTETTV
jgi:signal transduction histidine kinase